MDLYNEGIQQAREASGIFKRLGYMTKQAECLIHLAYVFHDDKQLDVAEEAASRAIDLLPEKGEQFLVCQGYRILGSICRSKGNTEKAIHHHEVALGIVSSLKMDRQLFWIHCALADLFVREGRFGNGQAHIESAKSHAVNDPYLLARASWLQARFLDGQDMFKEAKSEASHALDVFEKLGAANDAKGARQLLEQIDRNARGNGSHTGQTLGFALAKGLIRGLTRCPNPPSRFQCTTYFWMYPSGVHATSICRRAACA